MQLTWLYSYLDGVIHNLLSCRAPFDLSRIVQLFQDLRSVCYVSNQTQNEVNTKWLCTFGHSIMKVGVNFWSVQLAGAPSVESL